MAGRAPSDRWGSARVFPELTPLLVVDDRDVEALMRSARADLAKLSLELRALQHESAIARLAVPADAESTLDLAGAEALLQTGVEAQVARRRVERRAELERAQREALQRIADAEAEAAAIVEAAHDELLHALTGTVSLPRRMATFRGRPATPIATASDEGPPAPPRWETALVVDAEWQVVTEIAQPPPAPAPVPPPPPSAPAPAVVPPPTGPAPRPVGGAGEASRPSGWRGLLHLDVLLPLIAVVLVVVLLLAWVA